MLPVSSPRQYRPPTGHERLKLHLSWDGTDFVGWQSQPARRSVQDTLHAALLPLMSAEFRPVAAGRTDAGVHAVDMCVHVDIVANSLRLPADKLPRALNTYLPADLAVLSAEYAPDNFHARFSCTERRYLYRVYSAPQRHPLWHGRALHVPQALNLAAMQQAALPLTGTHDFAAYATQEERQSVRELRRLTISQQPTPHGTLIEFEVIGESFLRHMVRGLVGTLLSVGKGQHPPSYPAAVLASRQRQQAAANAAPHGLYFAGSQYGELAGDSYGLR